MKLECKYCEVCGQKNLALKCTPVWGIWFAPEKLCWAVAARAGERHFSVTRRLRIRAESLEAVVNVDMKIAQISLHGNEDNYISVSSNLYEVWSGKFGLYISRGSFVMRILAPGASLISRDNDKLRGEWGHFRARACQAHQSEKICCQVHRIKLNLSKD